MTLEEIVKTNINEIKEEPYKAIKRLSTIFSDNCIYKWYNQSNNILTEDLELLLKYVNKTKCKPYIIRMIPYVISSQGGCGYYELECDNCHNKFKAEYYVGNPYLIEANEDNLTQKRNKIQYAYCPYCGREIDWDNLQKRKDEIYEVIDNEEK